MAKNKPAGEGLPQPPEIAPDIQLSDAPLAPAGAAEPPADKDAEIAALKARIAELESAPPAPTVAGAPLPRFLVKLKDAPSWVVEAANAGEAWEAYRAAANVISSVNTPEITPTEEKLGRVA